MNDFSRCCLKRIGELDAEGKELSKFQADGAEVHVNGSCRVCGTWLSFNHVYWMWEGELDLGPASFEWIDQDSVVRPD